MVKSILILSTPLPYSKIGSWTTMYNFYIKNTNHQFDYIVCPKPDVELFPNVKYSFIEDRTFLSKIKTKLKFENRFQNYFSALDKIINVDEKYVIQIVDNSGLVIPLNEFLNKKYNRNNFYIQYYYQGFSPIISNPKDEVYFKGINQMLFLTKLAYKGFINFYDDFVCNAVILNNATISNQFNRIDSETKQVLKAELGFTSKLIFIWCSQDRPKKGLDLILQVWKQIYPNYDGEIELLIIGIDRKIDAKGVKVLGRIPNHELAKYYQVSDFYLFPTLWKEGFGIVLAEALKCGCYCIASNQGGVPEVLEFGKLGKIVENPNLVEEWVDVIEKSIDEYSKNNYQNPYLNAINDDLYDLNIWSNKMNKIIEDAKLYLK